MDNRKFLLEFAKGRTPQQRYYRLFEWIDGVKTLVEEEMIDCDTDIEVEIITNKAQIIKKEIYENQTY